MDLQDDSSLADLVGRIARDGDRLAFAQLFSFFAPRLKSFLLRQGADAPAAEELIQEVMLAVWRRAASFDPSLASVSTWIYTIARNKRIDAIRREKWPDWRRDDEAYVPELSDSAEVLHEAAQAGARLRIAIRTLPVEQAVLLEMAYFQDKSHRAIADETKLPLGTVKSRIRLALARLREALKE
jgi:RNA polymerase sigma-70 factor (ECF subfamily)